VLEDSRNWFVVDGYPPAHVDARSVLVSSPKRDKHKEFAKLGNCQMCYMPISSWSELERCRRRLYEPRVSKAKFSENFRL
jgi:hypothetical protein